MADRPLHDFTYPKGPDDHEGLLRYAEAVSCTSRAYHVDVERTAYRNVLYFVGRQWIVWDDTYRQWRPMALKKSTPRPVTNKLASLVNSTASKLVGFRVPITYSPSTDQAEDVAAANVAEPVHRVIERETEMRLLRSLIARWMTLTGNVFLINSYDASDETGTVFVPHERCVACQKVASPLEIEEKGGACPGCKLPGAAFEMAVDGYGAPMGAEYPRGKHYTEIETVFSCRYDNEVQAVKESPYFLVSRTRSLDWVAKTYGDTVAAKVPVDRHGAHESAMYEDWLHYATGLGGRALYGGASQEMPRTRIRRLWLRPKRPEAPQGIYAVLAGTTHVLESGPWAYHEEDGRPMFNVVHLKFDDVPGRVLGKSRVDDLTPKQDQRNRLESIFELNSRRMANNVWLLPEGVGVSRVTGEEGQIIRYNALGGVPPPSRVPGMSPPAFLLAWLQQIDQEMDAVFGTFEVGRGEAPRGVSAYSALALLDERAQEGQSSVFENWALGFMEWARQHLNIWREYADEERTLSLGQGAWAVQKFNAAKLKGGVDLDVDLGMSRPRSMVAKRAVIEQATVMGAISPYDPFQQYQILESLGVPELMPDFKLDMELAHRENDALMQGQDVPPPMPWENHAVQLQLHRRLLMSEAFRALPAEAQAPAVGHTMLHYQAIRAMTVPMGPGQIPPRPDGKSKGRGKREPRGTERGQLDAEAQMASPNGDSAAEQAVLREGV